MGLEGESFKMSDRVAFLRRLMREEKAPLAAYIILTDDSHQSEYIADCDKRREFISGFTGSAGVAVVTEEKALLWTDGRYHLQASQQLDASVWTLMCQGNEGVLPPEEWLAANMCRGAAIGFDPDQFSHARFLKYSKALESGCGAELFSVEKNLVDIVWGTRPPVPSSDLLVLGLQFCGKSWQDKVKEVRQEMEEKKSCVLVITALDEVAWLFNMRGADIDFNPVFFSYAIITNEDVRVYISEERTKLPLVLDHLQGIKLCLYSQVKSELSELVHSSGNHKIWISEKSSHSLVQLVPKFKLCCLPSPIELFKAIKNDTEIQGMKRCQIRDSAALCEYLYWLEQEVPKGYLNEVSAADKLEAIRRELPNFVSLSFPTISSSGCNCAIVHYRPELKTARKLSTTELYLCDSGAQYLDGTTDVTRTVSFGEPSPKEKECFTRVLKGHISLCMAIFPDKTLGNQLDCLARSALWEVGLDYKHGTGHGVGSFLNVHEGPHGISKARADYKPFQAGMFVTDEPGYYENGAFGMRTENVELIKKVHTTYGCALTMEPVTLVPIQLKMITASLLNKKEVKWLNDYHATCLQVVGEYLKERGKTDVLQWLQEETKLIEQEHLGE